MAKVFRIHTGGEEVKTGWFESNPIGPDDLKTIISDKKQIATSIPSPYARFDLVKSAFRWVTDNGLEGDSDSYQHKLVSDALDVGQLFFLSQNPQYKNDIKIVEWNPEKTFRKYKNTKHSSLFNSLEVFWNQDASIYNFDKVDKLYFIFYKGRLVGSTSPSTLFVSAPDASAENLDMNIWRGDDKLFDDRYASLAEREYSYIEYLFSISSTKKFKKHFSDNDRNELKSYLEATLESFGSKKRQKLEGISKNALDSYPACVASDSSTNEVSILNIRLGLQKIVTGDIGMTSDFIISTKKPITSGKKPMVLPQKRFNKAWKYTGPDDIWSTDVMEDNVPWKNTESPENSRLPQNGAPYYWLSAGNFLEDKIIRLDYHIDRSKYNKSGPSHHLLPLTNTFFEYFDVNQVDDLFSHKVLGSGTLEVNLKIPVSSGKHLEFQYLYTPEDQIACYFYLALSPFVNGAAFGHNYVLGLAEDLEFTKGNGVALSVFNQGTTVNLTEPTIRDNGDNTQRKSMVYHLEEDIDRLRIDYEGASGIIIPNTDTFKPKTSNISFAVDFGTTNTHIELSIEGRPSRSFEIDRGNVLISSLVDRRDKINVNETIRFDSVFEQELIPFLIGEKELSQFPLRTALIYNKGLDFDSSLSAFKHANNYLMYEKKRKPEGLKLKTDLKWSDYKNNESATLTELYIEYIVKLILFKSLSLGCKPKNVNIVWFYPVSMDENERDKLTEIWQGVYSRVFKTDDTRQLKRIPESIAPFLEYRHHAPGLSMSIDIGGGSTDISVFDENSDSKPLYISSFKFAGNSIFGDGYDGLQVSGNSDRNGFVQTFKDRARQVLKNSDERKLILDEILNVTKVSSDFSNFLFTLEKDESNAFSYTKELQKHSKLKLPFLVFFSAIAYYSARMQKLGHGETPKHILLSGTGAKSSLIIDSKANNFANIESIFRFFFHKIFETNLEDQHIEVSLNDKPKEVTCKGGLLIDKEEQVDDNKILFWLGGHLNYNQTIDKDLDIKVTPKYGDINDHITSDIENSLRHFFKLIDEYIETIKLKAKYDIDHEAYTTFKAIREKNLGDYLTRGRKAYFKDEKDHVEETLFFYPLIGIMNKLAFDLSQVKQ